jgi:uncharacterized RDD family membrane protein YckC
MDEGTPITPMPPPPAVEAPTGVGEPAGFWRRFAAAFVDGLVIGVVGYIIGLIIGDQNTGRGIGLLIGLVYFTYFHGSTGQTPGDAALGIRVVDVRDNLGQPIGYGRAFIRWIVSYISAIVILIGYLWMLWDPQKQTWHDKAAGSVPIKLRAN